MMLEISAVFGGAIFENFLENSTHLAKGALAKHGEEVELLGIRLRHGRREHGGELELHLGVTGALVARVRAADAEGER